MVWAWYVYGMNMVCMGYVFGMYRVGTYTVCIHGNLYINTDRICTKYVRIGIRYYTHTIHTLYTHIYTHIHTLYIHT